MKTHDVTKEIPTRKAGLRFIELFMSVCNPFDNWQHFYDYWQNKLTELAFRAKTPTGAHRLYLLRDWLAVNS